MVLIFFFKCRIYSCWKFFGYQPSLFKASVPTVCEHYISLYPSEAKSEGSKVNPRIYRSFYQSHCSMHRLYEEIHGTFITYYDNFLSNLLQLFIACFFFIEIGDLTRSLVYVLRRLWINYLKTISITIVKDSVDFLIYSLTYTLNLQMSYLNKVGFTTYKILGPASRTTNFCFTDITFSIISAKSKQFDEKTHSCFHFFSINNL